MPSIIKPGLLVNYLTVSILTNEQAINQQNTTDIIDVIGSQVSFKNQGSYIPYLSSTKDLGYDTDTIIQNSIIEKISNTLFRILKVGLIRIDITFTSFIHHTNTAPTLTTKIVTGNNFTGDQIDTPVTLVEYKKEVQVASDTDVRTDHAVETTVYTYHYYFDGTTNENDYIKIKVEGPNTADSFIEAGYTLTFTLLTGITS